MQKSKWLLILFYLFVLPVIILPQSKFKSFKLPFKIDEYIISGKPLPADKQKIMDEIRDSMYNEYRLAKKLNKVSSTTSIPNWRNMMGPVGDQGNCNTCYAFAISAIIEGQLHIFLNSNIGINIDENDLVAGVGRNCYSSGATLSSVIGYVANNKTISSSGAYPNLNGVRWGVSGDYGCVGSIQGIKDALEYGPVAVVFKKYNDFNQFFQNNPTGVYRWNGQNSTYQYHAVAIVSYNDNDEYWVCKNSYGSGWGDGGYFKIGFGECDIEITDGYRVTVDQSCIAKIIPYLKSSLSDAIKYNSLANNEWIYEYSNETLTQEISNDSYLTGNKLIVKSGANINLGSNSIYLFNGFITIESGGTISNSKASITSGTGTLGYFNQFNRAAVYCSQGQTIYLNSGTYNENVVLNNKTNVQIYGSSATLTGSLSIDECSTLVITGLTVNNGGSISISNTSPFNIISLNSSQAGSQIYMTNSYGQIYGIISSNTNGGIFCYDTDCYMVEGSEIKSEYKGANLLNTSLGYLQGIVLCNNTWDIYTDGTSYGYGDYSSYSGNPVITTYGNVTYSNYTVCNWPKRMPSANLLAKDPAYDDFVKVCSNYFALQKKIHSENLDITSIDYSKYKSDYISVIDNFNSFITLNPNSELAKSSLSAIIHIYKAINDYEGMKTYLDATANNKVLLSLNGLARKYMIDYYCNQKDYNQALTIADGIIKEKSTDTGLICYLLYSKGLIYQYLLDMKVEAQEIYEIIITNYPDDASVELAKLQLKCLGVEVKENKKSAEISANEEMKFDCNNYPNPFNPNTTISYCIPSDGKVIVKVFDVLGRELATLVNQSTTAGKHSVLWNGNNFASGIYFYSVTFKNQTLYKKMLLVK